MEFNQETNDENEQSVSDEETNENSTKQWIQDNLRVLVSIFIVVIIAAGIYSYSNRSQDVTQKEQAEQNDLLKDTDENNKTDENVASQDNKSTDTETKSDTKTSSVTTSQETEQSFVETAGAGDSLTKLARKALSDYLEKNADSTLTPEHKIYIEDYLRKNVNHKTGVKIGTSVEFSKSLINDAITKSKTLNAGQLNNLHKYAVRVPSLT